MQNFGGIIEILLFLAVCFWFVWWMGKVRRTAGSILVNGHRYTYIVGDDLVDIDNGHFCGIDVELPKFLPHIYVDSNSSDRFLGPRINFLEDNRINLEGDFNKYFQLYALKRFSTEVLSIVGPDFMAALVDNAGKYDVEIFGPNLRLISNKSIYKHPDRIADIVRVAGLLMNDIDQRLQTWQPEDEDRAGHAYMPFESTRMLKFGRRTVSLTAVALGIVSLMFAVPMYIVSWGLFHSSYPLDPISEWIGLGAAMLFFPISWILYQFISVDSLGRPHWHWQPRARR